MGKCAALDGRIDTTLAFSLRTADVQICPTFAVTVQSASCDDSIVSWELVLLWAEALCVEVATLCPLHCEAISTLAIFRGLC